MAAQYRPYRDEDDVPPEERAWVDDGPSGRIQIYEKTTHDIHHVVTRRHLLIGGGTIAVVAAVLGLCLGYFAHTEHSTCIRGQSVALFSIYDEDPRVKDKILNLIDEDHLAHYIHTYESDDVAHLDDAALGEVVHREWRILGPDEVYVDNFMDFYADEGDEVNTLEVIYTNGTQTKFKLEIAPHKSAFVAFSINGTFEGNLTYASKLDLRDAMFLKQEGIANDSILLVRYGAIPLSEQIRHALALGARGILFYQDPAEYPSNNYNASAVLRISASHLGQHRYEDDTPDIDAFNHENHVEGGDDGHADEEIPSEHDEIEESRAAHMAFLRQDLRNSYHLALHDMPMQTISGELAHYLLSELEADHSSPQVHARMLGGFPKVAYNSGPSKKFTVRLSLHNQVTSVKCTNVFAVIRGRVEPDRYIIIGAGRDRWSPSSVAGTAILQELVRVFSELVKEGWRPRRTIIFASFGAEHESSIGIKRFLEKRQNVLKGRAVAYIDVTNPVMGSASILATGSPLLSQALYNVSKLVKSANTYNMDGTPSSTLFKEWLTRFPQQKSRKSLEAVKRLALEIKKGEHTNVVTSSKSAGSNSVNLSEGLGIYPTYLESATQMEQPTIRLLDHTDGFAPFITQAGVPVVAISYVDGDYMNSPRMDPKPAWFHTQFDNLTRVHASGDTDYRYHMAIAKVVAELTRDLTDSLFVPFNLIEYAVMLQVYAESARDHYRHIYHDSNPQLFEHLDAAVENFTWQALRFHHRQDLIDVRDPMTIRMINDQVLLLERAFLQPCSQRCRMTRVGDKPISHKHALATPAVTYPHVRDLFPDVLELIASWVTQSPEFEEERDLRMDYVLSDLEQVIRSAAETLEDVQAF